MGKKMYEMIDQGVGSRVHMKDTTRLKQVFIILIIVVPIPTPGAMVIGAGIALLAQARNTTEVNISL